MSVSQTYSREYLQSIPQERKQQQIDCIISFFINDLKNAAALGKTSYTYTRPAQSMKLTFPHPPSPYPELTDAEIIAGFLARFPGCNVYYDESWVETNTTTRVLKKGIVIDWSQPKIDG